MKKSTVRRLIGYIGKSRRIMAAVFVFSVISGFASLICPLLIGKSVDTVIAGGDIFGGIAKYLIALAVLYAIHSLLLWITGLLAHKVAIFTAKRLRDEVFAKLTRLPLGYFDKTPAGETVNLITNDIEAIDDGLSHGIVQLVSGVSTVLIALGFMLSLNYHVALAAVFITPLCFFTGFLITRYGRKRFTEQADAVGAIDACADEMIGASNTVKAFCYEENAKKSFRTLNEKLYGCGWKAQFASALVNPTTRFVNNTAYVLVGIFGILAVIDGNLTAGGITAFLSYTSQFSKPINEMTSVTLQLQLATAGARRVFALLDLPEETPDADYRGKTVFDGNIGFNDVSFAYEPSRPLIKHFSVDVKKGTKVAVVGRTGAGKTTVVNLLMRFYNLDSGSITVDGIDISSIPRDILRGNVGMVLQETWLFGGTVRDNIAYGRPDADDETIISAAVRSHADSFIRRLPNGYDTVIDPSGGGLSAGQKQLIAISRVMLMDAPITILDEATSNVDILTEKRIQKAFSALTEGRTSFVIAHRLSTIQDSDLILVMENGDIAEKGTHAELLAKGGIYSKLYYSFDS